MPDVVMVTGASAGAGRSMAKRFAAAGFDIADFAFELFESHCTVGMVDTADMSFHLGDHVHPTAQLTRARSGTP